MPVATVHRANTASNATEKKYAANGLRPKARNGVSHPRQRRTSRNQWQSDRTLAARPALKSAKELVHKFLLMGNAGPHMSPVAAAHRPATCNITVPPPSVSHLPAKTPHKAVAIAGTVLKSPSGSQLW